MDPSLPQEEQQNDLLEVHLVNSDGTIDRSIPMATRRDDVQDQGSTVAYQLTLMPDANDPGSAHVISIPTSLAGGASILERAAQLVLMNQSQSSGELRNLHPLELVAQQQEDGQFQLIATSCSGSGQTNQVLRINSEAFSNLGSDSQSLSCTTSGTDVTNVESSVIQAVSNEIEEVAYREPPSQQDTNNEIIQVHNLLGLVDGQVLLERNEGTSSDGDNVSSSVIESEGAKEGIENHVTADSGHVIGNCDQVHIGDDHVTDNSGEIVAATKKANSDHQAKENIEYTPNADLNKSNKNEDERNENMKKGKLKSTGDKADRLEDDVNSEQKDKSKAWVAAAQEDNHILNTPKKRGRSRYVGEKVREQKEGETTENKKASSSADGESLKEVIQDVGDEDVDEEEESEDKSDVDESEGRNPLQCTKCVFEAKTKAGLRRHKKRCRVKKGRVSKKLDMSCEWCKTSFKRRADLRTHMREEHIDKKHFPCTLCDRVFQESSHCKRHIRTHTGEKPYMCPVCGKEFSDNSYIRRHVLIHKGLKPFQCEMCGKTFREKSHLSRHEETHRKEDEVCQRCKKFLRGDENRCVCPKGEVLKPEKPIVAKQFNCSQCGKGFSKVGNYQRHLRLHRSGTGGEKETFVCKHCGKIFNEIRHLLRHERIHTGEKPFECNVCGKKFTDGSYIKRHMLIHENKKPYQCTRCNKSFRETSHLARHMWVHTGHKMFNCTTCGKGYQSKACLERHESKCIAITEANKEQLHAICDVCGKEFKGKGSLKRHRSVHFEEKPFMCILCKKKFFDKSCLRRHMTIHNRDSKNECKICKKVFRHRKALESHEKTHNTSMMSLFQKISDTIQPVSIQPVSMSSGNILQDASSAVYMDSNILDNSSQNADDVEGLLKFLQVITQVNGPQPQTDTAFSMRGVDGSIIQGHSVLTFNAPSISSHGGVDPHSHIQLSNSHIVSSTMTEMPMDSTMMENVTINAGTFTTSAIDGTSIDGAVIDAGCIQGTTLQDHNIVSSALGDHPMDGSALDDTGVDDDDATGVPIMVENELHGVSLGGEPNSVQTSVMNETNMVNAMNGRTDMEDVVISLQDSGLHDCETCNSRFTTQKDLANHMTQVHHDRVFAKTEDGEIKVEVLIEKPKKWQCPFCNNVFAQESDIRTHKCEKVDDRPFACEKCFMTFKRKPALVQHMKTHSEEPRFVCKFCGKTFNFKNSLSYHEKTHTKEKPYKCSFCEKAFADRSHLVRHEKMHQGVKPYACKICPKTFLERSQLVKHIRVHSGERPYLCSSCGKSFSDSSHLRRHQAMHQVDTEPSIPCPKCNKKFRTNDSLRAHQRTHKKDKVFTCSFPDCSKTFNDISHLRRHERAHNGDRPYKCQLCTKAFHEKFQLVKHFRVHTGERPFSCSFCDKKFADTPQRKRHVAIVHANECAAEIKILEPASQLTLCNACGEAFTQQDLLLQHINEEHQSVYPVSLHVSDPPSQS